MDKSINFRDDKQDSINAVANPQELASKVNELKDLQDEIANAEESIKKLKEKEKSSPCLLSRNFSMTFSLFFSINYSFVYLSILSNIIP